MNKKILFITLLICISILGCSSDTTKSKTSRSESKNQEETESAQKIIEQNFENTGITNYEQVDLKKIGESEGVKFDDFISYHFFYESDGLQIEAYLSASKSQIGSESSNPCLIYNHGGNRDYGALVETDTLSYTYNLGMICIATNYRGCGKSEGTDEFGGEDVNDVIKLIDLCDSFEFIDNSKINMLGVSRGGMMTYETLRRDDRINKAVIISGTADAFIAYEDRADMRDLMKELIGATPEEQPEEYKKRSATYWADEINTPLLIFHTTGDTKVSIKEADKLASLLSEYGKDYEYISFESDIHCDLRQEDKMKIKSWIYE